MKLSQAIRLGAMLHPQCFGTMREWFDSEDGLSIVIATCALGAAETAGYRRSQFRLEFVDCPACTMKVDSLSNVITHLNDHHRWTRERIADWVATVEPADRKPTHDAVDISEEQLA